MTQVILSQEYLPETKNELAQEKKHSSYHRFTIAIKTTPPRFKTPHPFNPQVKKVGLAFMLLRETLEYNFKLRHKGYRKRLLSRPCIYGVFGRKVGGFWPVKHKCVGCCVVWKNFHPFVVSIETPNFHNFPIRTGCQKI